MPLLDIDGMSYGYDPQNTLQVTVDTNQLQIFLYILQRLCYIYTYSLDTSSRARREAARIGVYSFFGRLLKETEGRANSGLLAH